MKKPSTLVVSIALLTCFLISSFRLNAQTGPVASINLSRDSTNTLIDFDSVFFAPAEWPYTPSQSGVDGFNVINSGDEILVYTVTASHPDIIGNFNTSITLLPGEREENAMVFRPTGTGLVNAVITITTNDPNHEEIVFNVKGYGLESPVDNSTMQLDLIVGETVTRQMIVRNTTPNKANFKIQPEIANDLNLTISTNGVPLDDDGFILESEDSVLIDLSFEYAQSPGEDVIVPLKIVCEPFHYRNLRSLYAYKYISVRGVFPFATIDSPASIYKETPVNSIDSVFFELRNKGNTELHYSIDTDSLLNQTEGIQLLSTGFEEFTTGIAQRQNGWAELSYVFYVENDHDWTVETTNPFVGSKHLRCTSNNFNYGAELFAPGPDGNATIIDMMVNLDLGAGSQWEFRAIAEGYIMKKFIVASDGSLRVLDESFGYESEPISGQVPTGYFNLRFILNNTTHEFTIAIDGVSVYTAFSSATKFVTFSMGKDEQGAGSIMDVDNFRWIDGRENIRMLSVETEMRTVSPIEVQQIKLRIDTRNSDPGTYSEIFTIRSNDEVNPVVFVPVTIVVKPNAVPELFGNFTEIMFSGETKSFTFSATDADDSLIVVSDHNFDGSGSHGEPAGYVAGEVTASGNKFLTYTVTTEQSPYVGFVKGTVQAKDARGGVTTKFFYVTILPFRENDFILTNFKNGSVVANFTDTVTLDVAHPDIDRLTIQANFPSQITGEGMMFTLDGVEINRDRSQPYYLSSGVLPKLSEGYHILLASSYYQTYQGSEADIIETRQTIVHVINSAAITNYEVVTRDGVKIMDLTNGSVIDFSQVGSDINIIAKESIASVRSVKFVLNNVTARVDNGSPYALGGNPISGDTFWKVKPGNYTLSATPYLKYYAWGPKGKTLTIQFKVINGTAPNKQPATPARLATSTNEERIQEEDLFNTDNIVNLYPVPVVDELHIELHESLIGNVVVNIVNAQGRSVHSRAGEADQFRRYSINTVQLGMSRGVYFVIVNGANGKRFTKKFIKE